MTLAHDAAGHVFGGQVVTAISLLIGCLVYAAGARHVRTRRAPRFGAPQMVAFAIAVAVLAAALLGPLDARASERFSAHMIQHLLLTLVAAPLLVLARAPKAVAAALGRRARRAVARVAIHRAVRSAVRLATNPFIVWGATAGVLWGWHLPSLYDAAFRHPPVHFLEHASFLLAAAALWQLVAGERHRVSRPAAVALMFGTALQSGALGAVLVFASDVLYAAHAQNAAALRDQQIAGALMWVPSGFVYIAVMLATLYGWFSEMERRHPDAEPVRAEGR